MGLRPRLRGIVRRPRIHLAHPYANIEPPEEPELGLYANPTDHELLAEDDADALDAIAYLFSAEEWPGPGAIEDIAAIVRTTGRNFDDNADWISH